MWGAELQLASNPSHFPCLHVECMIKTEPAQALVPKDVPSMPPQAHLAGEQGMTFALTEGAASLEKADSHRPTLTAFRGKGTSVSMEYPMR